MSVNRRLLLVHAHPDDESINNAATMARYAAEGAHVSLVTCTLGELGEILDPQYAGLAADRADQLGGYRISELKAALAELGVTDHRFLGGAGRWRDSGMMGTAGNRDPRSFWRCADDPAAFDAATASLVEVLRELRPQVVITYNEQGGYGHPDHIMAHRVTLAAIDRAAADDGPGSPWSVAKLYYSAYARSQLQQVIDAAAAAGDSSLAAELAAELEFGVADDEITTTVDGRAWVAAKLAALRAHRTQLTDEAPFFLVGRYGGDDLLGYEQYQLVRGKLGDPRDGDGRETDLFAGLAS